MSAWLRGETEPPVATLIGIRLLDCQEGRARLELDAGQRHHNPMGTLHGGILCDLADVAMGVAMASTLGPGESFSTVELHIHYFRPVTEALLTATGRVSQRTRNTGFVECEIYNEGNQLVAKAASTCLVKPAS